MGPPPFDTFSLPVDMSDRRFTSRVGALLAAPLLAAVLASCGGAAAGQTAPTTQGGSESVQQTSPAAVPAGHVHAVDRDPGSGNVLLATHEGLLVYRGGQPVRVGPVIDLMGFTVAGSGHYYASGHPGAGTDLPEPVGLIESRDGGKSWQVLSRGGQSDFHALTATRTGVVGYDGTVRTSADGTRWDNGGLASAPRSLAGSGDHRIVLATTDEGLMRSRDGGRSWSRVAGAPLLYLVDWANGLTAVGVTPRGDIYLSGDGGSTWQATELTAVGAQAFSVSGNTAELEILAVTEEGMVVSRRGAKFVPVGDG